MGVRRRRVQQQPRAGVLLLGALGPLVRHRGVAEPLVRLGTRQLAPRAAVGLRVQQLACLPAITRDAHQSVKAMSGRDRGELTGWI